MIKIVLFLFSLFTLSYSCTWVQQSTVTYSSSANTGTSKIKPAGKTTLNCSSSTDFLEVYTGPSANSDPSNTYWDRTLTWFMQSPCPDGQLPDPNGICKLPPPKCDWATNPPYHAVPLSESKCNNGTKIGNTFDPFYLWNFSWCQVENTCYGRYMNCPAGQFYDLSIQDCREPNPDPQLQCPSGFYKSCSGVSSVGGESCSCEYTCKAKPSLHFSYDVSCAPGPSDPEFPINNPDAPQPDDSPKPNWYNAQLCMQKQTAAKTACVSPNILSFSCDLKTGIATSSCRAPTTPTPTDLKPEDSSNAATAADMKSLFNKLPLDIRDSLKDFFTDGSMPHLEAIRGSLQAMNIQLGDSNDLLTSISASVDAGLSKADDTNKKLDGIKSSSDGVKLSVDGVQNAVNGLKSSVDGERSVLDQIKNLFSKDDQFPETDNLQHFQSSSIFDEVSDAASKMSEDATVIIQQYGDAKDQISNGFAPTSFPSGACPNLYGPFNLSADLSKIGYYISPYSSFFALFIYLTVTFANLRFLFLFFIARSK